MRSGTARYQDAGLVAALGIFLAVYAGGALCFYWFMQPTVVKNYGLSAYHPPPKTVVIYADSPWVPPAPSEPPATIAAAEPIPKIEENSAVAPKIEVKTRAAPTPARRERHVRAPPNPFWSYASGRSNGFRPWF